MAWVISEAQEERPARVWRKEGSYTRLPCDRLHLAVLGPALELLDHEAIPLPLPLEEVDVRWMDVHEDGSVVLTLVGEHLPKGASPKDKREVWYVVHVRPGVDAEIHEVRFPGMSRASLAALKDAEGTLICTGMAVQENDRPPFVVSATLKDEGVLSSVYTREVSTTEWGALSSLRSRANIKVDEKPRWFLINEMKPIVLEQGPGRPMLVAFERRRRAAWVEAGTIYHYGSLLHYQLPSQQGPAEVHVVQKYDSWVNEDHQMVSWAHWMGDGPLCMINVSEDNIRFRPTCIIYDANGREMSKDLIPRDDERGHMFAVAQTMTFLSEDRLMVWTNRRQQARVVIFRLGK